MRSPRVATVLCILPICAYEASHTYSLLYTETYDTDIENAKERREKN